MTLFRLSCRHDALILCATTVEKSLEILVSNYEIPFSRIALKMYSPSGLQRSYNCNCGLVRLLRYSISRGNCNPTTDALHTHGLFTRRTFGCIGFRWPYPIYLGIVPIRSWTCSSCSHQTRKQQNAHRLLTAATRDALLHICYARVGSVICKLC